MFEEGEEGREGGGFEEGGGRVEEEGVEEGRRERRFEKEGREV